MTTFKQMTKVTAGKGQYVEGTVTGPIAASTNPVVLYHPYPFAYNDGIRSLGLRVFSAGGTGAKAKFVFCNSLDISTVLISDLWDDIDISAASTGLTVAEQSSASISKYGLYNPLTIGELCSAAGILISSLTLGLQFTGASIPSGFKTQFYVECGSPTATLISVE